MSREIIDVFGCKTSTPEEGNWVITATRQPPGVRRRERGGDVTQTLSQRLVSRQLQGRGPQGKPEEESPLHRC